MIKKREAIVLAGGFGTRLAHILPNIPKPMASVCGRPFLRYVLDMLAENDFHHVVIADGYKKECIEDYFGSCYRGIQLDYSQEEDPLLTGGAVKRALSFCAEEWVYVLNGDTYLDIDFESFEKELDTHCERSNTFIAVKKMNDFDRYGTVRYDEVSREISSFEEKRFCSEGQINAGVYLLKADSLKGMPKMGSVGRE